MKVKWNYFGTFGCHNATQIIDLIHKLKGRLGGGAVRCTADPAVTSLYPFNRVLYSDSLLITLACPVLSCPVVELSLNLPFLHIFSVYSNSIECHQIKCTFGRRLHQWLGCKSSGIQQGCTVCMFLLLLHSGSASMTHP